LADLRHPVAYAARRGLAAALFFALAAAAVSAQAPAAGEAIGSITYLEGTVSVVRDGEDLGSVAIGQDVQAFDTLRTGDDGLAEITISAAQLPKMTIKMRANTQFAVETGQAGGKQQTTVGILGGQVALKVSKLLSTQSVGVRTDSAAMGVRGTDFTVVAPTTGDVLVTCDEGEVAVTDDQGKDLSAVPGSVVEKQPGDAYRTVPVAVAALEQFQGTWREQRRQFLEQNALRFIRVNARLYRELSRQFNALHTELNRNQGILRKWAFEDRARRIGSAAEVQQERKTIGELLVRMRRVAFRLERVSFRLERLQALHDRGVGAGDLEDGTNTKVFFAQIARERRDVARKLALTRFLTKQFLKRNEGRLPE
jgi:hypothetical protein